MTPTLADSYRGLTIMGMSNDLLDSRSKVIKQIVTNKDFNWMLDSIRLFLNKPLLNQDFKDDLTSLFFAEDPLFKQKDNDLELRVLCGAILNEVVEGTKNKQKLWIALAATSGFFNLNAAHVINKSVIENILKYIQEASIKAYSWEEKKNTITLSFDNTIEDASVETLKGKFNLINEQFKKLSQHLNERSEFSSRRISILEEESNVHWWIFRGYSNIFKKTFKEIDPLFAPIVVGKELSELTNIYPFPPAFQQFLSKVLKDALPDFNKEISIKDVVNIVDENFKSPDMLRNATTLGNLCPLLHAYSLSVQSGDANGWISIFQNSTGIQADTRLTSLELAKQSFIENLIIKNLE